MPREGRLSRAPPEPPRPRHRATPAPHGNTRYGRRKNGPQRQTRRARGVERSPPGDGLLGPRERSGREGFPTFSEVFPSRDVFRVSCLGFPLYGRRFYGDGTLSSPRGYFFVSPGVLAQQLSARLCAYRSVVRASPVDCFFFCFLLYLYGFYSSMFIFFLFFGTRRQFFILEHYLLTPEIFFLAPIFFLVQQRVCPRSFFLTHIDKYRTCLLYTSPSPRDKRQSRMPSSA